MNPMIRTREYLIDNIGHMTYPGNLSFDPATEKWFVPICCRTERADVILGDIEVDRDGHIVYAPIRKELVARLGPTDARKS